VDWKELESKVKSLSRGLTEIEECKPVIDTIIQTLRRAGDKHSWYLTKEKVQSLTSAKSDQPIPPVESNYLGDNIGYIKVPEFGLLNINAEETFATQIQDHIKETDEKYTINSWIVDLRRNSGGTMHPMV